jgi:hypothetical protein
MDRKASDDLLRDPTDLPVVMGAIVLLLMTSLFLLPSYGWLWYWPIPAVYLSFTIYERFFAGRARQYASPLLHALGESIMMLPLAVGAILGGLVATRLFSGLPKDQIGAVSIIGACLGFALVLTYMSLLIPSSYEARRGPESRILSANGRKFLVRVFMLFTALIIVSWSLVMFPAR